jgi:alpha-L-fucosidase
MIRLLITLLIASISLQAQTIDKTDSISFQQKMAWFKDAKLGIFIHWGIYAVNGVSESWSFFNGEISHEDYLKQTEGFTAQNYNPDYWANLIKGSGAKYAVITSKHHDGFALWDTRYGNLNAVKESAAKRDVLSPFITALRKNNLKVGLYYSLPDWSYKDYTHFTREVNRYKIEDEPRRWQKFKDYSQGQLIELRDNYNPDLWWFDGDWEHNAAEWEVEKIKAFLSETNAKVIFNSRLQGKGDYETPEIGIPVQRPEAKYWELCMTMNDNWGYRPQDNHYKSPQQIIDIFVDCISKGGNLLLDIGPKADGTIPVEQENILIELGKWTSKHGEAIYNTKSGIPYDFFYGPSALSKDSTVLYLYIRDNPKEGQIALKGISNNIKSAYIVGGDGTELEHEVFCKVSWNTYPGITYINISENAIDKYYTVLAVVLDGAIKLYGEKSGAIESN